MDVFTALGNHQPTFCAQVCPVRSGSTFTTPRRGVMIRRTRSKQTAAKAKSKPLTESNSGTIYQPYWSDIEICSALKDKSAISGTLNIKKQQLNDSYVKHPLGDADVYIRGLQNRNRALPTDIVVVAIHPKMRWRVFDTFVKTPAFQTDEEETSNKRRNYVSLGEFLDNHRAELEQLIGSELVEKISADLNSCADPVSTNESSDLLPWWSVFQRTGHVVGILHRLHSRTCIGYLTLQKSATTPKKSQVPGSPLSASCDTISSSWNFATLVPVDTRIPYVCIHRSDCPIEFRTNPESFRNVRYVAHIVAWPDNSLFPKGQLLRNLSSSTQSLIDTETDRILITAGFVHGLDATHNFPDHVNQSAKEAVDTTVSSFEEELYWRNDFRPLCVFSIDPSTARDLDDALHVRRLSDKEIATLTSEGCSDAAYEVGIHIADVSYFVRPRTPLDQEASTRATTIYLVQLCVPMLPDLLSEQVCSLNPGEDKLTFSVVFKVNVKGEILKAWFGRSVIRSCAKLSYENAQFIIDDPSADFPSECAPKVFEPHSMQSVRESVLQLHELAMQRRRRRFSGGSLRLDQVKASFVLSDDKKMPVGISPAICRPSNWLVEEWMLAANEAVAKHLAAHLPAVAFLRRHTAPSLNQLLRASSQLESIGIHVDTETAGSIQASICREAGCAVDTGYHFSSQLASLCADVASRLSLADADLAESVEAIVPHSVGSTSNQLPPQKVELEREARLLVAVYLLTKTMNLAEYFCLGELSDSETTDHYALNMEFYTHFTSPIRRYADIIVHRQLAATLARSASDEGKADLAVWYSRSLAPGKWDSKQLQIQAEICNAKKLSARQASEESMEVFFVLFVKDFGPLVETCTVIGVLDRSFDVLILSCGLVRRVHLKDLDLRNNEVIDARTTRRSSPAIKLCLLWNSPPPPCTDSSTQVERISSVSVGDSNTVPSCGCFYTEIKMLDVVLCQVTIDQSGTNANSTVEPLQNDAAESRTTSLPKLRVTLLRPTCSKCCASSVVT
ncbi:unnamed protein product [Dicrocoelium dendriticum]|nr:unnamed protein product [Dicrocoelium dendriticum]